MIVHRVILIEKQKSVTKVPSFVTYELCSEYSFSSSQSWAIFCLVTSIWKTYLFLMYNINSYLPDVPFLGWLRKLALKFWSCSCFWTSSHWPNTSILISFLFRVISWKLVMLVSDNICGINIKRKKRTPGLCIF